MNRVEGERKVKISRVKLVNFVNQRKFLMITETCIYLRSIIISLFRFKFVSKFRAIFTADNFTNINVKCFVK